MRKRARFFRRIGGALMLAAAVLTAGAPASAGDETQSVRSSDPGTTTWAQGVEWTRIEGIQPCGVEWTF